jgi:hypothetical protein
VEAQLVIEVVNVPRLRKLARSRVMPYVSGSAAW